MYKTAIPISIESMQPDLDKSLNKYLQYCQKGNIERVFIAILQGIYSTSNLADTEPELIKKAIDFFKSNKIETGVWIGGFGHGSILLHDISENKKRDYQKIAGVLGEEFEHGYCPLDEKFTEDYLDLVKRVAKMNPDMIMLDDDFRLSSFRSYDMGCFCPLHLKEFYRLIGEEIPREKIKQLVYTGGRNKYRDAYMDMLKSTLLEFAKKVEKTVHNINKDIRISACLVPSLWDIEGTDGIEIARTFAGETQPYLRFFGAPYHDKYTLVTAIERERLQASWTKEKNADIEVFAEGDVYPRPRYNVPSKALELFDLALVCDDNLDGILKYMFDYDKKVGYETGYIDNHIKNLSVKNEIQQIFEGKKNTGVSVFCEMHKARSYELTNELENDISQKMLSLTNCISSLLISKNAIPTCYEASQYPVAVIGENAKYISLERMGNGVILDITAAKILSERGIDVGLLSAEEKTDCTHEYYINNDEMFLLEGLKTYKVVCNERARILTTFLPYKSPGVYAYENDEGIRFLVYACDLQWDKPLFSDNNSTYFNNYHHQAQLIQEIEWCCKKKLPVVCKKHPNLYVIASRGEKSMSVFMANIFMDEILNPEIVFDKEYSNVRFINCSGELKKDKILLNDIPAYGFAAFEVE